MYPSPRYGLCSATLYSYIQHFPIFSIKGKINLANPAIADVVGEMIHKDALAQHLETGSKSTPKITDQFLVISVGIPEFT